MTLNKVMMWGRLARDPEFKQTSNGKGYCTFSVAVNGTFNQPTADFFECRVWNNDYSPKAENFMKCFTKGTAVYFEGMLKNNNYTDKNGVQRYENYILVENFQYGETKAAAESNAQYRANVANSPVAPQQNNNRNGGFNPNDFVVLGDEQPPF